MELVREVHRQDPILLEFKPQQPAGVEVATWGRPGVDQRLPGGQRYGSLAGASRRGSPEPEPRLVEQVFPTIVENDRALPVAVLRRPVAPS